MTAFAGPSPQTAIDGTANFFDADETTDPSNTKTLLEVQTPASGISRRIHQLFVNCNMPGSIKVLIDGALAGSGKTGPGSVESFMSWIGGRDVPATKTVKVTFDQLPNHPTVPIRAHLQVADKVI